MKKKRGLLLEDVVAHAAKTPSIVLSQDVQAGDLIVLRLQEPRLWIEKDGFCVVPDSISFVVVDSGKGVVAMQEGAQPLLEESEMIVLGSVPLWGSSVLRLDHIALGWCLAITTLSMKPSEGHLGLVVGCSVYRGDVNVQEMDLSDATVQ